MQSKMLGEHCIGQNGIKEINGDTLTPISIFSALKGKHKILFESNAKFKQSGRYSFIACNPVAELFGGKDQCEFNRFGKETQIFQKPVLQVLKEILPIRSGKYPFAFFGGAIGYFGYETAFHFEKIGKISFNTCKTGF